MNFVSIIDSDITRENIFTLTSLSVKFFVIMAYGNKEMLQFKTSINTTQEI